MKRRIVRHVSLATGVVVLFAAIPAWAGVEPTPFRTGLFGVAVGQKVRVSVLNAGYEDGTNGTCADPDPVAQKVQKVRILDLAGAPLFEARGDVLTCGKGMFVDVALLPAIAPSPTGAQTPGGALPASARRIQVRAEVELDGEAAQKVQKVHLILTLEVFDIATGRTEFTMPFAAVAFNPQPEPPEPVQQQPGAIQQAGR